MEYYLGGVMDISKDWTPEDRLNACRVIAQEMRHKVLKNQPHFPLAEVYDWEERLSFIISMDRGFLEKNREGILGGKTRESGILWQSPD